MNQVHINRCHGALCAGERVRIRQILRSALALFAAAETLVEESAKERSRHAGAMLVLLMCRIRRDHKMLPPTLQGREPRCDHNC